MFPRWGAKSSTPNRRTRSGGRPRVGRGEQERPDEEWAERARPHPDAVYSLDATTWCAVIGPQPHLRLARRARNRCRSSRTSTRLSGRSSVSLVDFALVCGEGSQYLLLLSLGNLEVVETPPKLSRHFVEFLG